MRHESVVLIVDDVDCHITTVLNVNILGYKGRNVLHNHVWALLHGLLELFLAYILIDIKKIPYPGVSELVAGTFGPAILALLITFLKLCV